MKLELEPKELRMLMESRDEKVQKFIRDKIKSEPENFIENALMKIIKQMNCGKTSEEAIELVVIEFKNKMETEVNTFIDIKSNVVDIDKTNYAETESCQAIFDSSCKLFNVDPNKIIDVFSDISVNEYTNKNPNIVLVDEPLVFINTLTDCRISRLEVEEIDDKHLTHYNLKSKQFNSIEEVDDYLLNRTTTTYLWRIGKIQNVYIVRVLTIEEIKEGKTNEQ